ncbi:MAG: hypothetical protein M3O23_08150 [Actinomycetota bacterium]|nr:hypothetical protein [Actinomycetota bacterium]
MRSIITRERGHWPRSLILIGLLALGTACGGGGDTAQPGDRSTATVGRSSETSSAPAEQQRVLSSSLAEAPTADAIAGRVPFAGAKPPPPPDLGTQRPVAPPNTVSLEELHRQGRTHVLR